MRGDLRREAMSCYSFLLHRELLIVKVAKGSVNPTTDAEFCRTNAGLIANSPVQVIYFLGAAVADTRINHMGSNDVKTV